jgi:hypothetical protein
VVGGSPTPSSLGQIRYRPLRSKQAFEAPGPQIGTGAAPSPFLIERSGITVAEKVPANIKAAKVARIVFFIEGLPESQYERRFFTASYRGKYRNEVTKVTSDLH